MDMCLHRGGKRYRLSHRELQRVVPAQQADLQMVGDIRLVMVEGQPALVFEPAVLVQTDEQQSGALGAPVLYAVIGYNGDTLAAVAADHVEIATFESGNDYRLPVNLILNRPAP